MGVIFLLIKLLGWMQDARYECKPGSTCVAMVGVRAPIHRSSWLLLALVAALLPAPALAKKKTTSEGLWVVFAACAALGLTFVLALFCVRGSSGHTTRSPARSPTITTDGVRSD